MRGVLQFLNLQQFSLRNKEFIDVETPHRQIIELNFIPFVYGNQ